MKNLTGKNEEIRDKPINKANCAQIIFLIILVFAVAGLFSAVIGIYRYHDMLSNPVGYNMEQFGLNYCTCYDSQMRIVPIKGLSYTEAYDKYVPKPEYTYDIPKLNYNLSKES